MVNGQSVDEMGKPTRLQPLDKPSFTLTLKLIHPQKGTPIETTSCWAALVEGSSAWQLPFSPPGASRRAPRRPRSCAAPDLAKIAAARGGGPDLEFLAAIPALLPQPREWPCLFPHRRRGGVCAGSVGRGLPRPQPGTAQRRRPPRRGARPGRPTALPHAGGGPATPDGARGPEELCQCRESVTSKQPQLDVGAVGLLAAASW